MPNTLLQSPHTPRRADCLAKMAAAAAAARRTVRSGGGGAIVFSAAAARRDRLRALILVQVSEAFLCRNSHVLTYLPGFQSTSGGPSLMNIKADTCLMSSNERISVRNKFMALNPRSHSAVPSRLIGYATAASDNEARSITW